MPGFRKNQLISGVLLSLAVAYGPSAWAKQVPVANRAGSSLPAKVLDAVLHEREVVAHASLDDVPQSRGLQRYSFQTVMLVHAPLARTRATLTDYQLYAKMIPYIHQASFNPATHLLRVEGGIFNWVLRSQILFQERGEREIHYIIVGGHFTGLEGNIGFEPEGERGTLVSMNGSVVGKNFPPAFVIERGAEIVFGFTAKRMRSYIESPKENHDSATPQPRSHL